MCVCLSVCMFESVCVCVCLSVCAFDLSVCKYVGVGGWGLFVGVSISQCCLFLNRLLLAFVH